MFFAFVAMDAQKYYVCTGNSVYLRIGPGKVTNQSPTTLVLKKDDPFSSIKAPE